MSEQESGNNVIDFLEALMDKDKPEGPTVKHVVWARWMSDGRIETGIEGITAFRHGDLDVANRLLGRTLRAARGHSNKTGEERYVTVR